MASRAARKSQPRPKRLIARATAGDKARRARKPKCSSPKRGSATCVLRDFRSPNDLRRHGVAARAERYDIVLYRLQTAPDLAAYVRSAPKLNPMYGQMRAAAVAELKLPGGGKSALLSENMARARFIPPSKRYVVVDVPSARLWMYENNQPVDSMKLVVGMDEYRTPLIASVIYYTTFNPYWHAPDHLVRKAIAPNALRNSGYLKAKGYEVLSEWSADAKIIPPSEVDWKGAAAGTVHLKVRQHPGGDNSMGKMKFPFENGDGVFLHDTPHREHFAKSVRTISNGCVRLEDAPRFVRWLYGRDVHAEGVGADQNVVLPTPVPVYLLYMTRAPEGGTIAYEPDSSPPGPLRRSEDGLHLGEIGKTLPETGLLELDLFSRSWRKSCAVIGGHLGASPGGTVCGRASIRNSGWKWRKKGIE